MGVTYICIWTYGSEWSCSRIYRSGSNQHEAVLDENSAMWELEYCLSFALLTIENVCPIYTILSDYRLSDPVGTVNFGEAT